MRDKPLPSIAPSPGISTPVVNRVIRMRSSVALEPSLSGSRIRARRSPDVDEQHRMYLQAKKEETYWSLRMRNRP